MGGDWWRWHLVRAGTLLPCTLKFLSVIVLYKINFNSPEIHATYLVTRLNAIFRPIEIDIGIQKRVLRDAIHILQCRAHNLRQARVLHLGELRISEDALVLMPEAIALTQCNELLGNGAALGGADGGAGHVLLEEHADVEIDIVLVVIDGQDLTPARVHRWLLAPVKLAEFRVAHAKGFHRFIPGNAMLTTTLK